MNYEFSIKKSGIAAIIISSAFLGVLLFGAGLLVGSQWLIDSAAASGATAKTEEPALPKEPVLNDEKTITRSKSAPAKSTAEPEQEPATVPQAPEETAQTADTKLTADEVRIIQEAAAEPGSEENAASEPEFVTVQVGVFLDENEANRLLKDMERKGYAPSFFSGRDAEARQWYAVRIGAYSDKQQAANAAANFARHEKMKAVVRPLGSL